MLGAVPIKSELIFEVQRFYGLPVFDVVVQQWKTVVTAVREAEKLIVVGYSFPREDQYGRFLFREAVRLRKNPLKLRAQGPPRWSPSCEEPFTNTATISDHWGYTRV